jgi:Pyruvate/2-oxoacid:ferredoxin oxidoreductase gamma subunit
MTELERSIALLKKRIRLVLMLRHALAFGAVGAAAAIAVVILSQKWESLDVLWIPAALVTSGLACGAVFGAVRKLTPFAVARAVENRLDLKERLSSSVKLSGLAEQDEVVRLLLEDSTKHLQGVDPKTVFPHTFTRGAKVFSFLFILLLGLSFLPQFPAFQSKQRREEVRVMKQEGKKLVKLANDLEKKTSKKNEEISKQIARNMKALGKKMESGRISKKRAMLETKKLTKQIEQAQKKLAEQNSGKSTKSAEQAGKDFQEMGKKLDPETARKMAAMKNRLDQLSKLGEKGKLSSEQMKEFQELSKKLAQMKEGAQMSPEMLKKLADSLAKGDSKQAMTTLEELAKKIRSGKMSKAEMQKLAKELKALSGNLKGTVFEKLVPELEKAAKACETGDKMAAADALEKAGKMGKEIAEQLKDLKRLDQAKGG